MDKTEIKTVWIEGYYIAYEGYSLGEKAKIIEANKIIKQHKKKLKDLELEIIDSIKTNCKENDKYFDYNTAMDYAKSRIYFNRSNHEDLTFNTMKDYTKHVFYSVKP